MTFLQIDSYIYIFMDCNDTKYILNNIILSYSKASVIFKRPRIYSKINIANS